MTELNMPTVSSLSAVLLPEKMPTVPTSEAVGSGSAKNAAVSETGSFLSVGSAALPKTPTVLSRSGCCSTSSSSASKSRRMSEGLR